MSTSINESKEERAGSGFTNIPAHVVASVRNRLDEIERLHRVTVLFAAESGSRAWGFPSADSDFDVRFIYLHERNWYLSLVDGRDVIEAPIDEDRLDLSGWDFRKALRLALKSNPPLYEWLVSPIVYRCSSGVAEAMCEFAERFYSRKAMAFHYRSMLVSNTRSYFDGRVDVRLKKYFYSIRPLCALLWLREREDMPPMALQPLMDGIHLPATILEVIGDLLERKRTSTEFGTGPRVVELDRWIGDGITASETHCSVLPEGEPVGEAAEDLFRKVVLGEDS